MNGLASPFEQGNGMKYAPSIPDVFVGDIIYLFGSNCDEVDKLMNNVTSDDWEDALSSFPSSYD
jgi:hypothetical protein